MDMRIRPLLSDERKYAYAKSQELNEQAGAIGHLRGDFGSDGVNFYTSWFDECEKLKTTGFKTEFDDIINALRSDEYGMLKNRSAMSKYCREEPGGAFQGNCKTEYGFRADSEKYSYIIRCNPGKGDYEFYVWAYERSSLDCQLKTEGNPALPPHCYGVLHTGELIIIKNGEKGYFPTDVPVTDRESMKAFADEMNEKLGVTKAQAAAMLSGSMFGWDVPAANPNSYDDNGKAIPPKHKKNEFER